jgi:hypothetical protein
MGRRPILHTHPPGIKSLNRGCLRIADSKQGGSSGVQCRWPPLCVLGLPCSLAECMGRMPSVNLEYRLGFRDLAAAD